LSDFILELRKRITFICGCDATLAIYFASIGPSQILNRFYLTFMVILIPFYLVNLCLPGVLVL